MSNTLNQIIKDMAFDDAVDYKPWEEDLTPQAYYERGWQVGATAIAKCYTELIPVKVWQVKVFDDHDTDHGSRTYTVPACTAVDAQLMAFILDRSIEDTRYGHSGIIERGEMALACMHTEVISSLVV